MRELQAEIHNHSGNGGKVRLMFQDETGFGRINKPKYYWCEKGPHPSVPCHHIREYRYAYGGQKERQRPPLSQQKEFRSIKNAVIHEAENIRQGQITFEDKDVEAIADQDDTDIPSLPYECWKLWTVADDDTAPMAERDAAVAQFITKAKKGNLHAQYLTGKLYQDGPVLIPDSAEALYWFEQAANTGSFSSAVCCGENSSLS